MVKNAMPEEIDNVGNVSQSRYEQIVAELRDVVEQQTRGQFTIGDRALEIEPMREPGGHNAVARSGRLPRRSRDWPRTSA